MKKKIGKAKAKEEIDEEVDMMRWECSIIDDALRETAGGKWADALRQSCCDGATYEDIDKGNMPTSNRNEFFRARREFYFRVWKIRAKRIPKMAEADRT